MELITNWWEVLKRAWSVRFIVLAAVLSGLEVGLPLVEGVFPMPQGVFAGLATLATAGAFIARIIAQKDLDDGQK